MIEFLAINFLEFKPIYALIIEFNGSIYNFWAKNQLYSLSGAMEK